MLSLSRAATLAAIAESRGRIAAKVAARLKLSKKARKRLADAADPSLGANPRALAYRLGSATAVDRLLLANRPEDAASIVSWPIPRLPLTGGHLIARGIDQGPEVATTLRRIEDRWEAAGFPTGREFEALVAASLA